MKLWLLTTEFPPQSGGGISTYCRHTADMFAANQVFVTVFIPNTQKEYFKIVPESPYIRFVYFKNSGNQNDYLGFDAALSYAFAEVLGHFQQTEGEPDFIEAQEYLGIAYYPLQRKLLTENYLSKSVFYITAHAPEFLYREYNKAPAYELPGYWTGEMEKSVLCSADLVISPSHYLLNEISPYVKLQAVQQAVIRNPYLYNEQQAVPFTRNDIVFFGKLTAQKGCLEMLTYLKEMWDADFTGTLTIIGGDHFFYPLGTDMGSFIKTKFQDYIAKGLLVFAGHLPPEKIPARLKAAHVVVVPSITDNLPYTVLEAMALGKIVLVSEQGGQQELITPGENGFTFSHHNPDSFKNALVQILALSDQEISAIATKAGETIRTLCGYDAVFTLKLNLLQSVKRKAKEQYPYIRPRPRLKTPVAESEKNKLLSIVIPYYNMGNYIEECLQSIFKNDVEKEVIIVNDGSTDAASIQMLERVQAEFPLKVVHQKNSGLSVTRNAGAALAQGEYLAFLDADDCVTPVYYQKALHVLKAYETVSFVGCWAKFFGDADAVWPSFTPEPPYFLVHNTLNTSALVYKRAHFLCAGLNDPQMVYGMEDYESTIAMVENGFQGVVLPEVHWFYRIRKGSMSNKFNRYTEQYLYRLISNKHTAFFSEYTRELVDLLNANGPGMTYSNPTLHSPLPDRLARLKKVVMARIRSNNWLYAFAKRIYVNFFR